MSWLFGGSSASSGTRDQVSTEQRKDDQPLAKTAAKPTALRDWEQQAITSAKGGSNEGTVRPKWNPFLSLEMSEKFDAKMNNMRQLKDQSSVGEISLRSYEQQVLGAPVDAPTLPTASARTGGADNQEVEGVGKGVDGHLIPLQQAWIIWPYHRTKWTPAPAAVDKGSAMMAPDPDKRCMGVAYPHPHQARVYEYYEVACNLEFSRNDELSGHSAGCAGLCFHLRHKNQSIDSFVFFVRLGSDENAGDELVFGRLQASTYDDCEDMPTEIEVLKRYQRGKLLVNDGKHYFRVRSFCGGFMFYFNHAFVGFYEVKEQDLSLAKFGHCGIWCYDLQVSVHRMVQKDLEDMESHEVADVDFKDSYALVKVQHLIHKSDRTIKLDIFGVWADMRREAHARRMAPYTHLQGAAKEQAKKMMLLEWLSTLYTLQRFSGILNSPEHLKGRRMQMFLHELDLTHPPPPPPPLSAPPTPEDEELHYLYEMQQKKYQKQIENAGGKILGQEKFAELKNMTAGSLAKQQKDLVAQKQKQMAQHALGESEYQALTKMARRLLSNFGEMDDLVPAMKTLRGSDARSST